MAHRHTEDGPICPHRTKKACAERYADWQAERQVGLALWVSEHPNMMALNRSDDTLFGQLVRVMAGKQADVEGEAPFTRRVRDALRRWRELTMDTAQEVHNANTQR